MDCFPKYRSCTISTTTTTFITHIFCLDAWVWKWLFCFFDFLHFCYVCVHIFFYFFLCVVAFPSFSDLFWEIFRFFRFVSNAKKKKEQKKERKSFLKRRIWDCLFSLSSCLRAAYTHTHTYVDIQWLSWVEIWVQGLICQLLYTYEYMNACMRVYMRERFAGRKKIYALR